MIILSDRYYNARKEHIDDGYINVIDFVNDDYFTISDYREIVKIKRQNGKILIGQKYRRMVYIDGGVLHVYRESIPMSKLCHKYNLYEEY